MISAVATTMIAMIAGTLAKFNEKYVVVRIGNGLRILEEHRDDTGRVESVLVLKVVDFGLAVRTGRSRAGSEATAAIGGWISLTAASTARSTSTRAVRKTVSTTYGRASR